MALYLVDSGPLQFVLGTSPRNAALLAAVDHPIDPDLPVMVIDLAAETEATFLMNARESMNGQA